MFSDAHCDTISRILDAGQDLYENDGHVDYRRLKRQVSQIQFYAAWIDPKYEPGGCLTRCLDIIDKFYIECEKNQIPVITKPQDVDGGGAVLSVEGGSALCGRLSALRMLHKLGVRALTLTWNGRNALGDGVGEGASAGGLSTFGKSVVAEMNRLGMLVDVSHLSEKGFWDVAQASDAAFIASHSNAKRICAHQRNLTDEQIGEIVRRSGFIGINLCSDFLREGGASIDDILRHIEHMLSLGGRETVGFGADFDGVDDLPNGVGGVEDMGKIADALLHNNYDEGLVRQIMFGNLHRALKQILKN